MIGVLVVDDHPMLRAGLAQLLQQADDITLIGLAADGAKGVELALDAHPDVVLMDLEMPGLDGIEATRRIRASCEHTQVVILTSFSDRARILDALDAGAAGYLLKDAEPDQLLRGIRAAAAGEAPLAPRAASELLAERHETRPASGLTPREREVLAMVAEGLPNKLIARRLEISEKTVKAHLTRIFERLGVSDRTQAALWAQRHRLGVGR
ncbi:MAG TPA: response regulator transcription factor [Thermoleophilaceae bacterium]|jgi:DNA-binding NarL/FixJ family response regulator|nr:response regulator transcription factor [Thermoleophilaceae bacterium]